MTLPLKCVKHCGHELITYWLANRWAGGRCDWFTSLTSYTRLTRRLKCVPPSSAWSPTSSCHAALWRTRNSLPVWYVM